MAGGERSFETSGERWPAGTPSVDDLDLKIIDRLRRDPVVPSAHLASAFGVASATIGTRIQRLKTEGIATVIGTTPLPSAGYKVMGSIRIQLDGEALASIDELGRRLASMDGVITVGSVLAPEQLGLVYAAPNFTMLEQFVEKQLGAIRGVSRVQVGVYATVYKERADIGIRSPVSRSAAERCRLLQQTPLAGMLTEVELRLLSEVQVDGRLGKRELSRRLRISESMVRSRLNSLTEQRMLEYVLVVHPRALGIRRLASVEIDVDHRHLSRVVDALKAMPDVSLVASRFGRSYRLETNVHAPSAAAVERFLNSSLTLLEGVRGYRVTIFARGFKHDPAWRLAVGSVDSAA